MVDLQSLDTIGKQFQNLSLPFTGYRNYCANPNAWPNTTGWATYDDGAAVAPVDGTGGSPTATWTQNTLNPLRGRYDFKLYKDAANREGQGAAYTFRIDQADLTKVIRVSFDWLADTTLSTGDITVWVYDIKNGILIQPAPYQLPGTVAGYQNNWYGEFQAAWNSQDYRLIIHITSTSATAWNVEFGNIAIGQQPMKQGSVITDWQAWTPTGSWVSNCTYTGVWRRVGDKLECDVRIALTGAPTNTALTINLPSGLSIDTSKITNTVAYHEAFGIANIFDVSASAVPGMVLYAASITAVAVVSYGVSGAIDILVPMSATSPFTFANGDSVYARFSVPILGWSSNCQVSSDAETRVVACCAIPSVNITGLNPNNSNVRININTAQLDTHGAYNTGTYRYTFPLPGKYSIYALINLAGTNVLNNIYYALLYKNGSAFKYGQFITPSANSYTGCPVFATVDVIAGDYIELYLHADGNNSTNTLTVVATPESTCLTINRISGPSQIAASEKVYAFYNTAAGQALAQNATVGIINFDNKVVDTHGAVTTGASWKFTAPRAGFYTVSGLLLDATAPGAADVFESQIFKNGSELFECGRVNTPNGVAYGPNLFNFTLQLVAGDYISLEAGHNLNTSHVLISDSKYCWITIVSN